MAYNAGGRWNGPQGQRGGYSRPELPEGYLSGGYFEPGQVGEKPALRREYIVGYPEEIARNLEDRELNKSAQLRKFYDYAIRIRDMLGRGMSFREVQSDFCRLLVFADYARSRNRVSQLFVDFTQRNVDAVQSEQDFYAFLKHFEAVIAHLKK